MADIAEAILVDRKKFAFALTAFFGSIAAAGMRLLDAGTLKEVLTAIIWAYLVAQAAHDSIRAYAGRSGVGPDSPTPAQ